MDPSKATLEGMPTEIHWQILRNFLKPPETIELFPQDTYTNRSWVFGSLGILRVSKYFSAIGLSILYGENHFSFQNHERDLEDFDDSDDDDDEDGPLTHERLKFVRWGNLRNLPRDQLIRVSSVDCLDLISQTQPGQERLRKIDIDLSYYVLILFMGGSLLQILGRLRGLQLLEIRLESGWDDLAPTRGLKSSEMSGPERFGRDFLILIKKDLGHIKAITMTPYFGPGDTAHVPRWISHELKKRNKAWVPPPPAYMSFRRTTSSMSVLHPLILKELVDAEDRHKLEKDRKSVLFLEANHGVFP